VTDCHGVFSATILEKSNGDISAKDHPIHFMFGARVGFGGRPWADQMALFPVEPNSIGITIMYTTCTCKRNQCARSN